MAEEVKCPSCQHPVGDPVRPGQALHKRIPISSSDLMVCCKCLEFMQGKDDGTLRILTARERAYVIVHRTQEMVRALVIANEAGKLVQNVQN